MKTSELTISEQVLTFARTLPGKPVFLVLRVAADETDVQVVASTDLPAVFQLATDKRPIFGSTLTLVPEPAGTYIHIRYQPTRPGVHESVLTLESAIGTRTVTLTGRCTRMAAGDTRTNKALTRTARSVRSNTRLGRSGAVIAGAAVVVGLLFTGITYRCQLAPSLCQEEPTVGQQTIAAEPIKEAVATTPPVIDVPRETRTAEKPVAASVRQPVREANPVDESRPVARRSRSAAASEPTEATSSGVTAPGRSERPVDPKADRTVKRQVDPPRAVKPATEESDLERELNGRSNQDVPQ